MLYWYSVIFALRKVTVKTLDPGSEEAPHSGGSMAKNPELLDSFRVL